MGGDSSGCGLRKTTENPESTEDTATLCATAPSVVNILFHNPSTRKKLRSHGFRESARAKVPDMRKRTRPFTEDCDAISEIIGELLMVVIAVIAFGVLAVIMLSYMEHSDTLHVDVDGWVNVSADTIYFRHSGGEVVEAEKLRMILNLNGTLVELSSDNVTAILGKSLWQLGDIPEIDAMDRWGIDIKEDDYVGGTMIHKTTVIFTGTLLGEKTN